MTSAPQPQPMSSSRSPAPAATCGRHSRASPFVPSRATRRRARSRRRNTPSGDRARARRIRCRRRSGIAPPVHRDRASEFGRTETAGARRGHVDISTARRIAVERNACRARRAAAAADEVRCAATSPSVAAASMSPSMSMSPNRYASTIESSDGGRSILRSAPGRRMESVKAA